jgi:Sec7-like guanine-nucleotide exchange factor
LRQLLRTFRLPGEAQQIDRILEKVSERCDNLKMLPPLSSQVSHLILHARYFSLRLPKFAERFTQCNPESFRCEDGAYVLAFSIIMLNTDLHNRSIPEHKKMKMEEFIRNNRGIDDGQDPPREMLERIYMGIKEDEIVMNESDMYEVRASAVN